MPTKFYLLGGGALAIAIAVGLGYWHYTGLVSDLEDAKTKLVVAETAVATEKEVLKATTDRLDDFKTALEDQQTSLDVLSRRSASITSESRRIANAINSQNLERDLAASPDAALSAVNSSAAASFSMLDSVTGRSGKSGDASSASAGVASRPAPNRDETRPVRSGRDRR
jgi:peptidoglycan hydrolase CwlO-like protein